MNLNILFENYLEGEAIYHFLKGNGHIVNVYDHEFYPTEYYSHKKKGEIYIVDTTSLSKYVNSGYDNPLSDSKVIVIGSLRHLYLLFELQFRQIAYITKRESISEMLKSMESLDIRKIQISNRVHDFLRNKRISQQAKLFGKKFKKSLTKTEIQLLMEIGKGKTTNEIAIGWFRSIHTINNHRKNLIRKLGIEEVYGLAVFAAKQADPIRTLSAIDKNRSLIKRLKND